MTNEKRIEKIIEQYRVDPDLMINAKIMKTQVQGKSLQELQKDVRRLTQRANARLRSLEESGLAERSSAYQALKDRKGTTPRFKTKTENIKQAINKIRELEAFIEKKTSSVRGTKQVARSQEQYLNEIGVDFEDEDDRNEFFEMFNSYMDKSRQYKKNYSSTQIRDIMIDAYTKQKERHGYVDKKRLYQMVRDKINAYEKEKTKKEKNDFTKLVSTPKTKTATSRTRSNRGR